MGPQWGGVLDYEILSLYFWYPFFITFSLFFFILKQVKNCHIFGFFFFKIFKNYFILF